MKGNVRNLVRMQIQLTPSQSERIKALARQTGSSISELVRKGVDCILEKDVDMAERRKKALAIVGKYESERVDVSEKHDKYIAGSIYEDFH